MALRGTVTKLDRLLASLFYLFTLSWVLLHVWLLVEDVFVPGRNRDVSWSILMYLYPLMGRAISLGMAGMDGYVILIILLGLYVFVVRNRAIQYLVRFHTMQSLSLLIVWWLVGLSLFWGFLSLADPMLRQLNFPTFPMFMGLMGLMGLTSIATAIASLYSIFCAIVGKYGAVPILSKAVKSHLRVSMFEN